ncbi:hypothetical protein ZIOFF_071327 [Zingiber officinale]|uniref:Uncharacterized protein n=1 Tax=Zingiber officinale TaxID=94328 RepID=A0A8J5C9C9_ZINOF|nr:hypothetical protein ZIOFF_071327 [Zingiber officinale]
MNNTGPPPDLETFARSYQLEVLEKANKENMIIFLETGYGKTVIAVMLLRSYAFTIRKPSQHIVVFIVLTIILVTQVFAPHMLSLHMEGDLGGVLGSLSFAVMMLSGLVALSNVLILKFNVVFLLLKQEWDALMLSNFALENQLHTTRYKLSHALYQL